MTPEIIDACQKAGLNVVVTIGILGLCVWLVKWQVMRMTKVIDKLADKLETHEKEAAVRATFIRKEHEQMIETLGRINGYKN